MAYDITALVKPPRAVFVNFPMGNEIGRPGRVDEQRAILADAFEALERIDRPGEIVELAHASDDPAPGGGRWQDWVYTREFRRHHMKKRDGRGYADDG